MTDEKPAPSLNARIGAVALALTAPLNLALHMQGALAPLSYVSWLGFSFGVLCFCQEMGAGRPLNRAGLVFFAAAFCGATISLAGTDPGLDARARLLYAFGVLAALLLWSVAMMHRTRIARAVGAVGTAVGGGGLVLLVAAHVLVGTATIAGFSNLFTALHEPTSSGADALAFIDAVACVWALAVAVLLWKGQLRPQF